MSKPTFTPGPWTLIRQSNDHGEPVFTVGSEFAEGENKRIAHVASAAGWSDVDGKTHRAPRPAEANARLISKAPEMLDQLRALIIATSGPCQVLHAEIEKTEKLIARAEGRGE